MTRRLGLNGKWLAQDVTGTQRYAQELTRRLLPLLPDRPTLHVPADAVVPDWLAAGTEVRRSRLTGSRFEQLALPWACRRELLLSLGGPAPLAAVRQVVTMHDATPFRLAHTYSRVFATWYRVMYRVLARRALRIITVSEFSRTELAAVLGVDPGRFVVIPNGVGHLEGTTGNRRPQRVPDGPFALMVGPSAVHKNIAPVASALADRGIPVVIIGGGGSPTVFAGDSGAATAGSTVRRRERVHRLGRVTDAEVTWLYAHAGVLVFPSLYEGFGLPVVEAQRSGCPVVTSDRASLPEVAGAGALLVDPTSPQEVAEAAYRVLSEPDLAQSLREGGRANAARFDWQTSAERLAATVSDVTGSVSRGGAGRP